MSRLPAAVIMSLLCVRLCWGAGAPQPSGWRGDGTGRYPKTSPPLEWDIDEGTNILWKAPVGKSHSSPVVAGGRVIVTAEKDLLVCLDRRSGKILWQRDNGYSALPKGLVAAPKRPRVGPGGGYSIPTPVTDGKLVYASYGTGIVVCYDLEGRRRWIRYVALPQATEFGRSASPLLADGKLLVSIGGLIALEPKTGKTLWQNTAAKPSYGTPAIARIGAVAVAVTPNGDCVRVADGRTLATEMASTGYTSPLVHGGIVYFIGAPAVALKLPTTPADAIRPEKLWENDDVEGSFFASPVYHEGILYCVSNEGVLYALDAGTGKTVFQKQLAIPSMAGTPNIEPANIYGSLTLVGKHVLLTNDVGDTLVLASGKEYREVGHNYLDKGSGASPVPNGRMLFLRGGKKLYCIGVK